MFKDKIKHLCFWQDIKNGEIVSMQEQIIFYTFLFRLFSYIKIFVFRYKKNNAR